MDKTDRPPDGGRWKEFTDERDGVIAFFGELRAQGVEVARAQGLDVAMQPRYTDTTGWPRTARGKLTCPTCGVTGWPGGRWLDAHLEGHPHVCACGKAYASKQGLGSHRRHHGSTEKEDK